MSKFDSIRHYHDSEVQEALSSILNHPMFKSLIAFTFPEKSETELKEIFSSINSIDDFQSKFVYHSLQRVLAISSEGVTTSGFEKLDPDGAYLYISNHRDILLDTSLLNVLLMEHGKKLTASAIGDNLVKKSFVLALARLNRNFLVRRGLSPRELLMSSKLMSEFIYHMLSDEKRPVWIAQREGRTKDGNDATNPGVLKMIGMASDEKDVMDYFKKLKIVPVSISYEYDPTDKLKMPQLLAQLKDEVYIKGKNEDFVNIMSGLLGQKKHIHIHIGDVIDSEIDVIKEEFDSSNKQVQALANVLDREIISNYKLWPTNYIAYDVVHKSNKFENKYTENEKQVFLKRLGLRVDKENEPLLQGFLAMYSNPVVNKMKYENES
ncbi:1-acyl-sn-glycerol-3-phosphate acyltransferase [Paenimyroides tangerinum]|uniref:1-acyl-sn-glycerol-3-phosphate acyltransferase n=1 Tax=Paenimyroides tangerinum TaxID=2488728 RepID=A0A3P3WAP8_9FLAO|nr:1-acyl-sn-glycerol-3-phosphate acyltransferase [Paenimyroides tangerinum]RRJ92235.1 1-acyl-sn-glycerol-3-phosphate acyltransferase [Paenimyroides tangerinum]